ncbi:PucR family transcriptional regulator, partial [Streptomyces sp. SID11385]|nr:PucR family transcriptional regulator [Streptomyces sp. SID11385]
WQIVVASVEWEGETPGEATGRLARGLLEEVLAGKAGAPDGTDGSAGTDLPGPGDEDDADRAAVTQAGAEAVALVPLPAPTGDTADDEHAYAELN